MFAGVILAGVLVTSGEEFTAAAGIVLAAHVPIMILEGLVTGGAVGLLRRVRPEALGAADVLPQNTVPAPAERSV